MKSSLTFYSKKTELVKTISVITLFFSSFILYSFTSFAQEDITKKPDAENRQKNEKIFTFHRDKNGIDNYWKVIFRDGKIAELYKNGRKIPDENIDDYTPMINEELYGLQNGNQNLNGNPYGVNIYLKNLDSTLAHLAAIQGSINFADCDSIFDSEQFHKDMDSLRINLKKLRKMKFNFHFDTSAFNSGMKELRENLKNLNINPDIYLYKDGFPGCDMEVLKDGMRRFDEEMKHIRIFNEDFMINMPGFENKIKDLENQMKNLDFKMKDLDENMKKLNGFLKELKHELVNDNLIKDEDENFSMKFNSDELSINGNKVSGELLNKYKEIYKKHFGKEIDDEFDINRDNDENPDLDNK